MSNQCRRILAVLIAIALAVVGCDSSNQQTRGEIDKFEPQSVVKLHEKLSTSTSATGECASTVLHRWYGSDDTYNDLVKLYESYLMGEGWQLKPNSITRIWQIQRENGLFRFYLEDFSSKDVKQLRSYQMVYGVLPESFMHDISGYRTVYLVSLSFSYSDVAKRCSGK